MVYPVDLYSLSTISEVVAKKIQIKSRSHYKVSVPSLASLEKISSQLRREVAGPMSEKLDNG